ncbi:flagellar hook-basal body complex protein [Aliarcobacter skirrowii]|uniref:flagellar hook-basal body complex protein n=1 Tax=Aliarcobacter skirrowii TaxID=28200 RepID=UPI0009EF3530|nr:flagellar hook-basal body complex protein [Aliarcobacter skirrowii]
MIGALWTGISGLSAHQKALDNESNNIANVNTVGYKAGRISFADQIYQGQIGKGSYVQDAEKIFVTGGSKVTGVDYDVALQGDGFFTVINKNTLGTAETFYTRAGNLRMGESGTLQTADGYEVQGWAMNQIDPKNDVKSTNQNATKFTDNYIKMLGSSIIKHKDYIETIAAKSTNFNETAKSDAVAVFSGAGSKTQASKLKDISLATDNYRVMLAKYQEDPDAQSKSSTSQISQVNFKTGLPPTSIIGKDGDSIEVIIDGNVYNQRFVLSKTTEDYRQEIWDSLSGSERALHNLANPDSILALSDADQEAAIAQYDKVAGKIETYKALADKISNSGNGGLVAYLAKNTSNPTADILDSSGTYEQSTEISDMLQGVIQIEGLIPGKEFKITSVSENLGGTKTTVRGTYQSTALAVEGSGKAALESSSDALSRLISGNQRSVYTTQDLYGSAGIPTLDRSYTFSIDIYDRDLEQVIPVPNDGGTPPQAVPITIPAGATIDEIVDAINNTTTTTGRQLGDYIEAKNLNGYLVLETNKSNYDIEFDPKLQILPTVNLNSLVDNAEYSYNIKVNGQTIPISPIEVVDTLDNTTKQNIYDQINAAITAYNSSNPGHTIEVSPLTNGTFTLTSKDSLEATLVNTVPGTPINPTTSGHVAGMVTQLETTTFEFTPITPGVNTITVAGKSFDYNASASSTVQEIRDSILAQINNDADLENLLTATSSGSDSIRFVQRELQNPATPTGLGIVGSGVAPADIPFDVGTPSEIDVNFDLGPDRSKSQFTLTLAGVPSITVETSDDDTVPNVYSKVMSELSKYGSRVTDRYTITQTGSGMHIVEKASATGFAQAVNSGTVSPSSTLMPYPEWKLNADLIETNPDYSGRKGAGAEFMEITTRVDQLSSHDSLQLRLDKLDISDSKFGSFSVDDTGLITIKDGGVEFAVGQLSIARFTNNRGLEASGGNNFRATQESGNAIYSTNNNNTDGVMGQALEISKADLSESLVNLMVFQRAFEANAKSITTSDELLSTLINLKR